MAPHPLAWHLLPVRSRWGPLLILGALLAGCGGEERNGEEAGISEEAFISTYVGLRAVALSDSAGELPPDRRDSVLVAQGVTQDELLRFVDIRGGDAAYMRTVWDSVEARLQRVREAERDSMPPPRAVRDSVGG